MVKEAGQALLGRVTSMQLGIMKIGDSNSIEYSFGKIKNVVVDIVIDEYVMPVSQAYRRIPIPLEAKVNEKIEDLLEQLSRYQCYECFIIYWLAIIIIIILIHIKYIFILNRISFSALFQIINLQLYFFKNNIIVNVLFVILLII